MSQAAASTSTMPSPPPFTEASVSPLLWGSTAPPPQIAAANNTNNSTLARSNPIAIVQRNPEQQQQQQQQHGDCFEYDDSTTSSSSDCDDDDDDNSDVVHSFQQLVLNAKQRQQPGEDGQFCVGSLPTTSSMIHGGGTSGAARRQRRHAEDPYKHQFGMSLPAAPMLRARDTRGHWAASSIPPIALTESNLVIANAEEEEGAVGGKHRIKAPSYGSLRESQLAGRFLDGPSSYRERSSGLIKRWNTATAPQNKVRFQESSPPQSSEGSSSTTTPGERMQGRMRQQQSAGLTVSNKDAGNNDDDDSHHRHRKQEQESSSLSAMMLVSSSHNTPTTSTFHDYNENQYSLLHKHPHSQQREQQDVLSTSLTGLELLQRGLSIDDRPPDASHLSSWSSSGANTLDNTASAAAAAATSTGTASCLSEPQEEGMAAAYSHFGNGDEEDDDDDDDDGPVFDLDME